MSTFFTSPTTLSFLRRGLDLSTTEEQQTSEMPADVANAVSSTAAESLLMGIFVLICSFELRGVKAGTGPSSQLTRQSSPLMEGNGLSTYRSMNLSHSSLPSKPNGNIQNDDEAGSIYGLDENQQEMNRQESVNTGAGGDSVHYDARGKWPVGPLVLMMVLLHVIYPSFPISPQVELGRIITFLGFLWSVGPQRCIAVVNTEPLRSSCRTVFLAMWGAIIHAGIFITADVISDLIFPLASRSSDLYHGPRYLHQLLTYLTLRYPVTDDSFGPYLAWCVVSAVVFSSAVWKEFLFRGVYLGGLRSQMPFWAANVITAMIYALAHEPIVLAPDGCLTLKIVGCAPLIMGAMWYGYLYQSCNNLIVIVLAHLLFNSALLALHIVHWE